MGKKQVKKAVKKVAKVVKKTFVQVLLDRIQRLINKKCKDGEKVFEDVDEYSNEGENG